MKGNPTKIAPLIISIIDELNKKSKEFLKTKIKRTGYDGFQARYEPNICERLRR